MRKDFIKLECGALAQVISGEGCDKGVEVISAKTQDAATEKHVPYVEEKETHSSESRKQVVEQKQQVNLKTVQSKKINLQSILEEKVKGNEKKIDIIKIKTEKTK